MCGQCEEFNEKIRVIVDKWLVSVSHFSLHPGNIKGKIMK